MKKTPEQLYQHNYSHKSFWISSNHLQNNLFSNDQYHIDNIVQKKNKLNDVYMQSKKTSKINNSTVLRLLHLIKLLFSPQASYPGICEHKQFIGRWIVILKISTWELMCLSGDAPSQLSQIPCTFKVYWNGKNTVRKLVC